MKTYIARSIFETQACLEQAIESNRIASDQGLKWVSSRYHQNLVTTLADLRQSSSAHSLALRDFTMALRQRRSHISKLTRLIRDFYQVLRRRGQRDHLDHAEEILYNRPKKVPNSAPAMQWLQAATDIVNGAARAAEHGYAPMANPSAAEVEQQLTLARAAEFELSEKQQQHKIYEAQLRQARNQGTRALRGLAMRLRESMAHETPTARRQHMRTYGFSFISTKGGRATTPADQQTQLQPQKANADHQAAPNNIPSLSTEPVTTTPAMTPKAARQVSLVLCPPETPITATCIEAPAAEEISQVLSPPEPPNAATPVEAPAATQHLPQALEHRTETPTQSPNRDLRLKHPNLRNRPEHPKQPKLSRREKKALRQAANRRKHIPQTPKDPAPLHPIPS